MEVAVPSPEITILEMSVELAELRAQLAETQDQCIEMAVDAGHLHAEIRQLRRDLAASNRERDGYIEKLRRGRPFHAAA
jgi:uncharacterized protein involved in exopolysaccharide biosynthesis